MFPHEDSASQWRDIVQRGSQVPEWHSLSLGLILSPQVNIYELPYTCLLPTLGNHYNRPIQVTINGVA